MNSFISNSDPESTSNSIKLYAQVLLKLGLCMLAAILIIFTYLLSIGATGQGILGRVSEAKSALPQIIEQKEDLALFYGSSMTRAGFSPRLFDQALTEKGKQVKSFNFGFGGLNPYFQDFLSRRIVEEFQTNDRRLALVMIEFNPFQTTSARWNRAKPEVDSLLTLLASDAEIWEIAKTDIERGIRLFNIKYLRAGMSAEMITSYFAYEMFPPQRSKGFEDSEEVIAEQRRLGQVLNEQFEKDYPDYIDSQWSYEWQGGGTIPQERSSETLAYFEQYYDASFTDANMKNDRLGRIRSADIEALNFEPLLVEHFINTVKNFQSISDKVKVIILPKNSKWIHTTPEADARLAQVISQIEKETGIILDDHQSLDIITPDMFRDTTHLARYRGDVPYTQYLVEEYADGLSN